MLQLTSGRRQPVVTLLSEQGLLVRWPFFGAADEIMAYAIAAAGDCLPQAQRVALGLPPARPSWCRDPMPEARDTPSASGTSVGSAPNPGSDLLP